MVVLLVLSCYLLGSIPVGVIAGRLLKGIDIREAGSGNIGAANVYRTLGPFPALFVLSLDVLKGIVPLFFLSTHPWLHPSPSLMVAAGLSAILGHTFSIFLKFKGGKGIATSAGVFLYLNWQATLLSAGIWALMVALTRFSSVGSLSAALALPFLMRLLQAPREYQLFSLVACLFAFWTHRANIRRLLKREELRLGKEKG